MLTLPLILAAVTAGIAGGVHCVGMCGGISSMLSRAGSNGRKVIPISRSDDTERQPLVSVTSGIRFQALLQAGRLSTYMMIGAVFGGLGSAGMILKPYFPVHQILFVIGNLALIILGLKVVGFRFHINALSPYFSRLQQALFFFAPSLKQSIEYPFFVGMAWGCLPCGLLWGMAPFALLSGDAFSGAILMLLFGLSAMPHLLLSQGIFNAVSKVRVPSVLKYTGAFVLIGIGLIGLWYSDMQQMPGFLCVLPER